MGLRVLGLGWLLLLLSCFSHSQKLDSRGKNVCLDLRDSTTLVCCAGWKQQGKECSIPLCEGESTCQKDEICVFPGFCRCKHGFYGAQCKTRCPPEFWGPDCRELCQCHPHGQCHPETGKCTCLPNRWGALCQNACKCGRHGQCDPTYGNCTCDQGWWTSTCSRSCQCHLGKSACDPATGRCLCLPGYWGPSCSLGCTCYISPCSQHSGTCQCLHGWWGPTCDRRCNCDLDHGMCNTTGGACLCQPGYKSPFCNEVCSAGHYGNGCEEKCGRCKEGQPCSPVDGFCAACEPGWNGTRCDQPCPGGYHGDLCLEACPHCWNGEPCDPETGECSRCEPGWTGPRCDVPCPNGTFGDGCRFLCSPCFHGHCDRVTGSCVCRPGFQGESCNGTCPSQQYGVNCSSSCDCGDIACHPATGDCHYSSRGALTAGLLIPLLLVVLALVCCCCCCGGPVEGKDSRVAVGDGGTSVRMKHHVYNVLANMSSAVPCLTLWSSGLPRVTVSHHDPELTFNHSFIEPPSSGWVSDNSSSFESDDGETIYCVPPREDISPVAGGEFQEMSSKCNIFPDPSAFSGDDMSLPFAIPRTSSIAKAKRPSVSFAEGTKFCTKEQRGSTPEVSGVARKAKSPWGVLMLSALQSQNSRADGEDERGKETEEGNHGLSGEPGLSGEMGDLDPEKHSADPAVTGGRRRTLSGARRNSQVSDAGPDKVTTVYVTVGKATRPEKPEPGPEGAVQAVLRRLGSLQRQREDGGRPKARGDSISKPPRRKLGARASMWEQGATGAPSEVSMRKPSRRKHTPLSSPDPMGCADTWQDGTTAKRPLSSILTSVPENVAPGPEPAGGMVTGAACNTDAQLESGYLTVGHAVDSANLDEVIANEVVVARADDGPEYENVLIKQS